MKINPAHHHHHPARLLFSFTAACCLLTCCLLLLLPCAPASAQGSGSSSSTDIEVRLTNINGTDGTVSGILLFKTSYSWWKGVCAKSADESGITTDTAKGICVALGYTRVDSASSFVKKNYTYSYYTQGAPFTCAPPSDGAAAASSTLSPAGAIDAMCSGFTSKSLGCNDNYLGIKCSGERKGGNVGVYSAISSGTGTSANGYFARIGASNKYEIRSPFSTTWDAVCGDYSSDYYSRSSTDLATAQHACGWFAQGNNAASRFSNVSYTNASSTTKIVYSCAYSSSYSKDTYGSGTGWCSMTTVYSSCSNALALDCGSSSSSSSADDEATTVIIAAAVGGGVGLIIIVVVVVVVVMSCRKSAAEEKAKKAHEPFEEKSNNNQQEEEEEDIEVEEIEEVEEVEEVEVVDN